jgi:hypothetical protein
VPISAVAGSHGIHSITWCRDDNGHHEHIADIMHTSPMIADIVIMYTLPMIADIVEYFTWI